MEPISFGKKRALLVKDSSRRMVILNTLRQYASVRLWEKSQPRDFEEQYSRDTKPLNYETFQRLRQTPHLARFVPESRNKRGGVRECPEYFLFMTALQGSGSRKVCCFIEKKVPLDRSKIFQVRFRFQDELFAGTLCSGVFLMTTEARAKERDDIIEGFASYFPKIRREVSAPVRKNNWMFLADDLWVHRGKDVPMSLSQRLVCLQDILGTEWFPDTRLDGRIQSIIEGSIAQTLNERFCYLSQW
jgi:hypothetical protein